MQTASSYTTHDTSGSTFHAVPGRHVRAAVLPSAMLRSLEIALAAVFLIAGVALLTDVPAPGPDVEAIASVTGAGLWLRAAAGFAEVIGAVLLTVPARAEIGAALLGVITAAAAVGGVVLLHAPSPALGVLLAALGVVAYARRAALAWA